MGDDVVGCGGTKNEVYSAATSEITTISAIGNDGVGNVEGAAVGIVVNAATAAVISGIARYCGIGEVEDASVIYAAAKFVCSIAREGGIGDGEVGDGVVKDAAAIVGCRIARKGGIGDGEVAVRVVKDAAAVGCSIARDCGIGDDEGG